MPEETLDSKNEIRLVYNIVYFYNRFLQKHKYIDSLKGKKKKDNVLTLKQYKLIVKTYFKIYFYEVFYINKPLYFCLTGRLMRVRVTPFTVGKNVKLTSAITILWYLKCLRTMHTHCTIKLLRGSSSSISKIRQQWVKENDLGLLPMIMVKKEEMFNNKLMYQNNDKRNIFFQSNN